MADQLVVSGARFAVAWVLARWTTPANYGTYLTAFSAILMVEIAQAGFITWPMAVLAPSRTGEALRRYVSTMLAWQAALGAVVAVALLVSSALVQHGGGSPALVSALRAAAAAAFFVEAQEFCRRVLLSEGRPAAALVNDSVTAALQVALLAVLWRHDAALPGTTRWLTSANALGSLAAAACLAAGLGLVQFRALLGGSLQDAAALARENWEFGRWIFLSRLGEGALSHAVNFVMVACGGAAAAASLDAPRLLVAPLQVVSFGVLNLMLPRGSSVLQDEGARALLRFVNRAALLAGLGFAAYALLIAVRPGRWLEIAYAGRYAEPVVLLAWTATHLVLSIRVILSTTVYVLRRSDLMMTAMLVSGAATLAAAVPLATLLGPLGGALSRLGGELVLLGLVVRASRRAVSAADGA